MKAVDPIVIELSDLKSKLKTEKFSESLKQKLFDQVEQLVVKLDKIYIEWIRMIRREDCAQQFEDLSISTSYHRNLIKQYGHIKDCRNQTLLVSSTSADDKDPIDTVIDTRNGAIENAEENLEVFSRHSETQGSRKQHSITFTVSQLIYLDPIETVTKSYWVKEKKAGNYPLSCT